MRHSRWILLSLLLVSLTGACGGDDPETPKFDALPKDAGACPPMAPNELGIGQVCAGDGDTSCPTGTTCNGYAEPSPMCTISSVTSETASCADIPSCGTNARCCVLTVPIGKTATCIHNDCPDPSMWDPVCDPQ